jgi:ArsR family transcriptional regulator
LTVMALPANILTGVYMKKTKTDSIKFAKAMADPTRQKIMDLLCCTEMNVSDIAEKVGVKQPTATHHLNLLKELELVDMRIDGKSSIYTTNQERMVVCCGNLIKKFAPDSEMTIIIKKR